VTRLGFFLTRTLRREVPLVTLSVPYAELADEARGKRIAIVGNARSLSQGNSGPAIDGADLIARINRAPMPTSRTHGTRTDWLALATSISAEDIERIRPRRILWMSHKRKRLSYATATSRGFYLHPLQDFHGLSKTLGAPPTTGLMMIDLISRSAAAEVALYGFDFFASLSLTGSRTAEQVPHDFAAERRFVEALIARDGRFRLADR
jgi:hypothetical protein